MIQQYIGKRCVVQFKPGTGIVVCTAFSAEDVKPLLMKVKHTGREEHEPVISAFVIGTILAVDGFVHIEYIDSNTSSKMELAVDERNIFAVTVVKEYVAPKETGRIIAP